MTIATATANNLYPKLSLSIFTLLRGTARPHLGECGGNRAFYVMNSLSGLPALQKFYSK
jgi:hypothetical protein